MSSQAEFKIVLKNPTAKELRAAWNTEYESLEADKSAGTGNELALAGECPTMTAATTWMRDQSERLRQDSLSPQGKRRFENKWSRLVEGIDKLDEKFSHVWQEKPERRIGVTNEAKQKIRWLGAKWQLMQQVSPKEFGKELRDFSRGSEKGEMTPGEYLKTGAKVLELEQLSQKFGNREAVVAIETEQRRVEIQVKDAVDLIDLEQRIAQNPENVKGLRASRSRILNKIGLQSGRKTFQKQIRPLGLWKTRKQCLEEAEKVRGNFVAKLSEQNDILDLAYTKNIQNELISQMVGGTRAMALARRLSEAEFNRQFVVGLIAGFDNLFSDKITSVWPVNFERDSSKSKNHREKLTRASQLAADEEALNLVRRDLSALYSLDQAVKEGFEPRFGAIYDAVDLQREADEERREAEIMADAHLVQFLAEEDEDGVIDLPLPEQMRELGRDELELKADWSVFCDKLGRWFQPEQIEELLIGQPEEIQALFAKYLDDGSVDEEALSSLYGATVREEGDFERESFDGSVIYESADYLSGGAVVAVGKIESMPAVEQKAETSQPAVKPEIKPEFEISNREIQAEYERLTACLKQPSENDSWLIRPSGDGKKVWIDVYHQNGRPRPERLASMPLWMFLRKQGVNVKSLEDENKILIPTKVVEALIDLGLPKDKLGFGAAGK